MNHYNFYQQNVLAALEDQMRENATVTDRKVTVICPKPRRIRVISTIPARPLRWHYWSQQRDEGSENSKGDSEILGFFLNNNGEGECEYPVASSPPYFCGSPPSRAQNPLIQDAHFGDVEVSPVISASAVSSPSAFRMELGLNKAKAAIRIEGFDCHCTAVA